MEQNYLIHHGVKGQKWGVRRFQNKDGSLTPKGKKRYLFGKKKKEPHEDYKRAHSKTSVKDMSDQELRETNNRLQAERQYAQLTKKSSKGKKAVSTFIAVAGTATAVVTAAHQYKKLYDAGIKAVEKMSEKALKGVTVDTLASMAGKI